MKLRNALLIGGALTAFIVAPVLADVNYTQGSGTVIFDFLCFSTKHCSSHVPINSAGTEIFTSAAPAQVTLANTGANATAVKVDNSAVTQPVSSATLSTAANQASQLTQETTTATGIGAPADAAYAGSGSASIISILKGMYNALTGSQAAGSNIIGKVGIDQTTPGTTNNVAVSYGAVALVADPCQQVATVRTPISVSSAANIKIVTGTSAKKTHICGMMLFSAGTTNVGIIEGSGVNCATSPLGLIGGATAATGPNLTAQAGFVSAPTGYAVASTTVNANDICLINGSAIQVSGYIVTATP